MIVQIPINKRYRIFTPGSSEIFSSLNLGSEIIESHSITKAIVSYSKSKKIDLIVMGAHGMTVWDKLTLGSITDGVMHRVRCPVLIVR